MVDADQWPPEWTGETCVIVGGGPSLSFNQIRQIARAKLTGRCRVIAVNDAVYWCWWADVLHACDYKWINWHIQSLQRFSGKRVTLSDAVPTPWGFRRLKNTGKEGFDPEPDACRTGGNGAYQAMHMAIHAGVSKIVLVGVDMMRAEDGRTHCHGGHPDKMTTKYEETMAPCFPGLLPALKERGVSVVNCSGRTALTCFARAKIEDVL